MSEQIILLASLSRSTLSNGGDFKAVFGECVDEVLSALGPDVKQATYLLLEVEFGLSREKIPEEIEAFTAAIEETFGQGAKLLEIKILEKLRKRVQGFSFKSEKRDLFFAEYLYTLQNQQF